MDPESINRVKHLYEVEHLSMRQIARELGMCAKTISRIVAGGSEHKKPSRTIIIAPYMRLIEQWYARRPSLKAKQVYDRFKEYGYTGKYTMVTIHTKALRKKNPVRSCTMKSSFCPENVPR